MRILRLAGKLGAIVLTGGLLAGCNSTVQSQVVVGSSGNVTLNETVNLGGQAGEVVASSPTLQAELQRVIESRTGQPAALSISANGVSWSQSISYKQLTANSDVTGVSGLAYSPLSGNRAKVSVQLANPTGLTSAIAKAVAGRKDAAALILTMDAYTDVCVSVSFPGSVQLLSASGARPTLAKNSVSVNQPIGSFIPGSFVVAGSLQGDSNGSGLWYWLGGGALVIWFAWWMVKRR